MSIWSFIGSLYVWLGTWAVRHWAWIAAASLIIIGWLISEERKPLPQALFPDWYNAEYEAELIIEQRLAAQEEREQEG